MDFQQESTIKNLLPDWPEGYRAISARVLPGISSEYPCVAWSLHDDCTFLIPCSIFCAESNYRLSKSHRSKSFFVISLTAFFRFDSHGGPSVGFYCRFIVKVDPFDKRDFTVKAFQMGIKDCSNLPTNTHLFKVNCTISDEFPPRCYSKELGNIFLPHRVLNATPIPNVVYEAFVECKIFVKNDDGSRISASTEVEVRPELARIIRVKPLQSRLYNELRLVPPMLFRPTNLFSFVLE
ncbi:hypothetical protein Mgra_00008873 [Meloidogyne graminicola]|uniref:Uncharacterized protein n=1 Tax=Meloidogyne graminicola TaxID=189291 RepID=A0A8S9ZEJ1_9BILA|nr:hypothetical protein Mgra_00008873 [Meloidogyne graminicola]